MQPKSRLYALGRLKPGVMNKTEAMFSAYLKTQQQLGYVAWSKFEGIKLKLADATFLTPDFAVMKPSGEMELYDVKGAKAIAQDDARVKMKVAAEMYPFRMAFVYPLKTGGWDFEYIN